MIIWPRFTHVTSVSEYTVHVHMFILSIHTTNKLKASIVYSELLIKLLKEI